MLPYTKRNRPKNGCFGPISWVKAPSSSPSFISHTRPPLKIMPLIFNRYQLEKVRRRMHAMPPHPTGRHLGAATPPKKSNTRKMGSDPSLTLHASLLVHAARIFYFFRKCAKSRIKPRNMGSSHALPPRPPLWEEKI